jgi:hypothetical protein
MTGNNHAELLSELNAITKNQEGFKHFYQEATSKKYWHALRWICMSTKLEAYDLARILIEHKNSLAIDLNASYFTDQRMLMHYAAKNGQIAIYDLLKAKGANETSIDIDGNSALDYLVANLSKQQNTLLKNRY